VLARTSHVCNIVEVRGVKIVYRRYASLFFAAAIDMDDNELITLEVIHRYVQCLDAHFVNVAEIDVIYGFQSCMAILDELIVAGEMCEGTKKMIIGAMRKMEAIEEAELELEEEGGVIPRYGH
jgi:hypothetical protein